MPDAGTGSCRGAIVKLGSGLSNLPHQVLGYRRVAIADKAHGERILGAGALKGQDRDARWRTHDSTPLPLQDRSGARGQSRSRLSGYDGERACRPACQGPGKVTRLQQHLGDAGQIEWQDSYAYADSLTDLPLLERVGHPVAVYPDAELAALAQSRGWEIIGA